MKKILLSLSICMLAIACNESDKQGLRGQIGVKKSTANSKKMPASVKSAKGVLGRLLPKRVDQFVFEEIPAANGYDVFEVEQGSGGKIIVRGNTGVSICSGLNWYLKYCCNCSVAWSGNQLKLPKTLPAVGQKIRKVSPYKKRVYLNYCVFSYTTPWWGWERWQREIDIMALNGINMPLQVVGQEAVWLATFKKFGLTDKEMQKFFVGPAYFAWAWMTNLDAVGGPLPMSWIKSHTTLGQQICKRQRELGMTPIMQAFTGHIPGAFKKYYPKSKIQREGRWADCPGTYQLDPVDPMFVKIGKTFIEEQTRLFGTSHYYAADPFHEGHPPSKAPGYMKKVAQAILKSMRDADPKAKWIMQSWSLREQILRAVPRDDVMVLDLNASRSWRHKPFWGRDTVWGMFNDMGGRTFMRGSLGRMLSTPSRRRPKNLIGMGMFDEAIEKNPIMFEAFFENAWRSKAANYQKWVNNYVTRRYGANNADAKKAWQTIVRTAYNGGIGSSVVAARPTLSVHKADPNYNVQVFHHPVHFADAWAELVKASNSIKATPGYNFDLIEVGSQVLSNYALAKYNECMFAWRKKDLKAFQKASKEYLELLDDLDKLLATNKMRMLGTWISQARRWGTNDKEKNLYEYNARCLVTLWESDHAALFFDYSWRLWGGLVKEYYKPRWKMFFEMIEEKIKKGEKYSDSELRRCYTRPHHNSNDFYTKLYAWEKKWVRKTGGIPTEPTGNAAEISRALVKKYLPKIKSAEKLADKNGYSNRLPLWRQNKVKFVNITSGKPAKATATTGAKHVSQVVDGNIDLRGYWEASRPASITIDLKKSQKIDGFRLWTYWDGKRFYQYTIEVSTDGKNWTKVVDQSKNTEKSTKKGQYTKCKPIDARYIRLNMLKNSANPAMHVIELWAYPVKKK